MKRTTKKETVDEFFKKWGELQESVKKFRSMDYSKLSKKEKKVYDDFFNDYKQYSELSSQYASSMNQLVTDLGSNMAITVEAQSKAMGAMFQFYVAGAKDASQKQYDFFVEDIENLKVLSKVLENDYNHKANDDETFAKFQELWDKKEGFADFYLSLQKAGGQGLELLKNYITALTNGREEVRKQINEYILDSSRATVEYLSGAMMVGLASYRDYVESYDDLLSTQAGIAKTDIDLQAEEMRKAGVDEIKITEWVKNEKERIDKDYEVNRKQLHQQVNLEILSQGVEFVNNMSSVFADLYDGNKEVQKATIVVSTFANAAMAFGSTFANSPGGLAAKAVQAAAASAAVLASGIKAYRQVDSANKGTTLSGGGSAAPQTGTSAVSSTIIERQIQPVRTTSSTETVLVLSDVEAKQRQQQNVNKVSVI